MDLILDDIYPAGDQAFDSRHLRPLASLNRRQVIALPAADPAWVGRRGWELLSKHALADLVGARVKTLGLDGVDPANYPLRLNECLDSADALLRLTAEAIAAEFGRRLGCLVASLLLSPAGLSDPLTAWEAAYLDYWHKQVRHIFLGGGHASGRLGPLIARAAQEALKECGVAGYTFQAAQLDQRPLRVIKSDTPLGARPAAVNENSRPTAINRYAAYRHAAYRQRTPGAG